MLIGAIAPGSVVAGQMPRPSTSSGAADPAVIERARVGDDGDRSRTSPAGVPPIHDGLKHRVEPSAEPPPRPWMQPPSRTSPSDNTPQSRTLGPTGRHPSLGHSGGPELGRMPPIRRPDSH
ncbi:hypothetical protein D3260_15595 [Salinisphaera sp. Q1T1-3]|nr:hypothetical protein D3260_15595 [Salinisphaera sp. Q1T1-3]